MIDVVCNIDNQYTKYCAVMLTSLFANNKNESFHIHIVADALSDDGQRVLLDIVEKQYNHTLSFYLVGGKMLSGCPIDLNNYISISTYYRCFLMSILPDSLSKVLYLDCDLIVCGEIQPLWDIDICGYAVGCVEDMWSGKDYHYSRLQYDSAYSYFNAGVLLINLDYWRQYSIQNKIATYIQRYPDRLLFNDQDVLNAVLYDQKFFVPFRWNMQDGFFRRKRKLRKESLPLLEHEMKNAVIIHFTGGKKPWHDNCIHPYKSEYLKYWDMTQWKGERPPINYAFRFNRVFEVIQGFMRLKNSYRKINKKL